MKRFTKKQRLARYKIALNHILSEIEKYGKYEYGICLALVDGDCVSPFYPYRIDDQYPELKQYRPTETGYYTSENRLVPHDDQFWWMLDAEGTQKRIEVLKEVIANMM